MLSIVSNLVVGALAYAAGLTERPEPAAARELIPHFSWARIPRRDLFLPDLFLSLIHI